MKNKFYILLFAFTFIVNIQINAQSDSCSTEPLDSAGFESQPWFGNNDYLLKGTSIN